MACLWGQGPLLHDQNFNASRHLCVSGERRRSDWLGEQNFRGNFRGNFARARRIRVKLRRGDSRLQVRASFEELAANQVLVSAAAASILAQLAKPFQAALTGQGFNWKLLVKSGGMPSSHSATVTAVATALAFERGMSDGVFGLSVILAGVVMYDAQGVRNAVGKQAKVINTMVVSSVPLAQFQREQSVPAVTPPRTAIGSELARDPVEAELAFMDNNNNSATPSSTAAKQVPSSVATLEGKPSGASFYGDAALEASNGSYTRSGKFFELAEQLPTMKEGKVDIQELGDQDGWRLLPLKESIGHTKLEVLVGGCFGVLVSCIFHSLYFPTN